MLSQLEGIWASDNLPTAAETQGHLPNISLNLDISRQGLNGY